MQKDDIKIIHSVKFLKNVLKLQSKDEIFVGLSASLKISTTTISRRKKRLTAKQNRNKHHIKIDNEALNKTSKIIQILIVAKEQKAHCSDIGVTIGMTYKKTKNSKPSQSGRRNKIYSQDPIK